VLHFRDAYLSIAVAYLERYRNEPPPAEKPYTAPIGAHACPYHIKLLAMKSNANTKNMTPMERFLAEGSAEQSAVFLREDTGELSIAKGCTCELDISTTVENK
jgi:hypothetical protein